MNRIKSPQLYQLSYRPDSEKTSCKQSPADPRCASGVPPSSSEPVYHVRVARKSSRTWSRARGARRPIPPAAEPLLAELAADAIGYHHKRRRGVILRQLRRLGVTRRHLYDLGYTSADYWTHGAGDRRAA